MKKIYCVGLGYGDPGALTLRAWDIISQQGEIWLRTERHPVVDYLREQGILCRSFDRLYAAHKSFIQVYTAITQELLTEAARQTLVYGVPGDPSLAEQTVLLLREEAVQHGVTVEVVSGVSFIEPILKTLNQGLGDELQISDAQTASKIDPLRPHLFHQVWSKLIAGELKLKLLEIYPPEHQVTVISSAGLPGERQETVPLWQMDHLAWIDHLTSLYVPPLAPCQPGPHFQALENIMAYLRSPQGCPWDREQTHASLLPYLLEEAYELADAIKLEDPNKICEEMGDLLLQIAFHGQIASEAGDFTTGDSIRSITEKLVRRHPHVFAEETAESSEAVSTIWQRVKEGEEKSETSPGFPVLLALEKHLVKNQITPQDPLLARLAELVLEARREGRSLEAEATAWLLQNKP